MAYDTFIIYFLLFPTLSLTAGSLVYRPVKAMKGFLFAVIASSLSLLFIFFGLETLLLILKLKSTNIYFLSDRKLGHICWIRIVYYGLIPWLLASICLLTNRIPKKTHSQKRRTSKKNLLNKLFICLNVFLLACVVLLCLSFTLCFFYRLRLVCLNLLWFLLLFNLFLYLRLKRNYCCLYLVNWIALLASLYTLFFSCFVSEPLYSYEWGWPSPFFEGTLAVIATYFVASETLLLFSFVWHTKQQKAQSKEVLVKKEDWLYPFCLHNCPENLEVEEQEN